MSKLDRLQPIELRDIWQDEAGDFTPWLAEEENLALLSETLGLELELEGQEVNIGKFRADILCKNEDGSRVLIENQLEVTDHKHLGQILTYAAGLGADTIIWIAEKFEDEHRAALDRQNEMTDERFRYFGLEIELWRIGDSPAAPKFNIVSMPNNWSRAVSQGAQRAASENLSETQQLQRRFWEKFSLYLTNINSGFPPPNPQPSSQISFGIGKAGFAIYTTVLIQEQKIRVRLAMSGNNATRHFHLLKGQWEEIEEELGETLRWEELQGRESSWVALDKDKTNPANEADWPNQHEWLASKLELFDQVFRPRVKVLNAGDWDPHEDEDEA